MDIKRWSRADVICMYAVIGGGFTFRLLQRPHSPACQIVTSSRNRANSTRPFARVQHSLAPARLLPSLQLHLHLSRFRGPSAGRPTPVSPQLHSFIHPSSANCSVQRSVSTCVLSSAQRPTSFPSQIVQPPLERRTAGSTPWQTCTAPTTPRVAAFENARRPNRYTSTTRMMHGRESCS